MKRYGIELQLPACDLFPCDLFVESQPHLLCQSLTRPPLTQSPSNPAPRRFFLRADTACIAIGIEFYFDLELIAAARGFVHHAVRPRRARVRRFIRQAGVQPRVYGETSW